jgi:hypothetical protein
MISLVQKLHKHKIIYKSYLNAKLGFEMKAKLIKTKFEL